MSLKLNSRSESSDDGLSADETLSSNNKRIQTPPLLSNQLNGERFETLPIRSKHEKFLRKCVDEIFSTAIFDDLRRENKVLEWHQPNELAQLFDMSLKRDADTDETLLELLRKTIRYSVKTGHPYFVNQLYSSVDAYGLAGQWLTDALNSSVNTYEVTPVLILMEETVLRQMRSIIGWENGNGDGLFSPGGSISIAYGMSCARFQVAPDLKVIESNSRIEHLNSNCKIVFFRFRPKDCSIHNDWFCSCLKMLIMQHKSLHHSWALAQIMFTK